VNNSKAGDVANGLAVRGVVGGGPGSGDNRHERQSTPERRIAVPTATKVICKGVRREVCW